MKNRIILLLVLLWGYCVSSLSVELCQNGGIKKSSQNKDECPGITNWKELFNKGENHASMFTIPCDKNGEANEDKVIYSINIAGESTNVFTENRFANNPLRITLRRGEITSYGRNTGGNYTSAVQFGSVSLTASVEWSCDGTTWYCADDLLTIKPEEIRVTTSWAYNQHYTFTEGEYILFSKDLWKDVCNNSFAINQYNSKGSITIYFRFVYYVVVGYKTNRHGTAKTRTGYLRQPDNKWCSVTVNRCNVNGYSLKSKNTPAINGDTLNGYAIYEKMTSDIQVSSEVARYDKLSVGDMQIEDSEHSIFYRVYNSSNLAGEVSNSIELNLNSVHPGSQLELQRLVYFNNTQEQNIVCKSSNKLNFTVFPEPYLEGFDASETDTVFCQAKTPLEVGKKLNEQDSTVLYARLKGNRCDFKGFEEYSSTYGVVYGWRYWTNRNSSHNLLAIKSKEDNVVSADEIFDYNLDGEGPDLYFPLSALKPGVTYYFEQYVKLKNFENAVVEATIPEESGLKKFYTVRLSKGLNDEKLKLDVSQNEACYGENLENVVFKAEYEDSENYKDYCLNEKGFKFAWSMDGKEGQSYGAVSEERNYFPVKENHCFSVSLTDGCNNTIEKEACLEVHELPAFSAENIICQSSNVSLTYEIDEVTKDDYVLIKGMKGRQYDITISDEDKSSYNYYYSESEDGANKKKLTTYKEAVASKILYIFKETKNGFQCMSKPVKVKVVDIEEIQGNEFGSTAIYICPESKVPALNSENISDPMMKAEGVTYTYRWMYSNDNTTWKEMVNTDAAGKETRFTDKNYDGTWDGKVTSESKVYIRREVKAYLNGVEIGSHNSNSLAVSTYASPNPTIEMISDNTKTTKCYGENVKLTMTVNQTLLDQQKAMQSSCLSDYAFYNYEGDKYKALQTFVSSSEYDLSVKGKYSLYSGVKFCGSTIYSKTGVSVSSYDDMDVRPSVSVCKIVGQNVTIKASAEDIECTIGGNGVTYPDEADKSVATILLDKKQTYTYTVDLENTVTGCKATVTKHIQNTEIKDKLTPKPIGPNGNSKETVCAGVDVSLSSATTDEQYKRYEWSVDGVYIEDGNNASATYKFLVEGKDYEVVRECFYYIGNELCYTVTDKATISTYPKIDAPVLSLSDTKICNGENVILTATAKEGGSASSYSFVLMPGTVVSSEKILPNGSVDFELSGLTKDSTFYVVASDNRCNSDQDYYKTQSEKVKVSVEKDLAFKITSTKNVITRDEFKDGVVSIPVSCEGVEKGESINYTLNGENDTTITYAGAFSIDMAESLFEINNRVNLIVNRSGSILSSCTSDANKIFVLNDGFEGVPALTGNGQDQEIEVCGETDVELAVENFDKMTFADKPITSMGNPTWTWFRDNSVVAKTTDAAEYKVQAKVGKTHSYTVVFSGEDADGMKRKVSSHEFIVKGSSGIEVGRITFGGAYSSQNFVEFCNNKNSDQKISMSCELDPAIVDFIWKYSTTGAKDSWKNVPETWNGKESTKSKVITVHVDSLVSNGGENYYFQVEAKDKCDNVSVTTSKNMLQVKIKKSVELPVVTMASPKIYSAADPLPKAIDFNRKYTHTNLYEFVGCGETEDLGGTTQRVNISDLKFGENSVDVVRTELARISNEECVSDTLHYTYNIYQKLATPKLGRSDETITCPNEKTPKYLTLNAISGGDPSSYEVTWLYRLDEVSDWMKMNEGDNLGLFSAEFYKISELTANLYSQSISITNQTQSIIVRAIVACDKDKYPGDYVSSNDVVMEVYTPLKDNGIDLSTQEICYNTAVDTINGYAAEGGSGGYLYTWWSSEDNKNFEQIVKGEENNPYFAPRNFNGAYNLKNTTYFKRIVTDTVCKTSLESAVKTVYVRESFDVLVEDVDYSRIVTNDGRAELTGVTDGYEYVWWKSETKEMEGKTSAHKSKLTDPLSVPAGDDFIMVTFYAQAIKDGCRSTNKLPMEIYVYNQTGGHIFFEDEDSKANGYWICSGESDIQILSDEYARAADFLWYYMIDGSTQQPIMSNGKAVTTPEIKLDTTALASKVLLNDKNGNTKRVQIFRKTTVDIDGKENNMFSDTITINIVPTLESVSEALDGLLGDHGTLAGTIKIENGGIQKQYCIGDMPDAVVGNFADDDNLFSLWSDYKNYIGPWLYDKKHKGGFSTYYESSKNGGEWIQGESFDFSKQYEYAGMDKYYIPTATNVLDGTYTVRRVLSDGCTVITSNEVVFSLFDKRVNADTVETYAFTPEMTNRISEKDAIREGYEIGDSIIFVNQDRDVSNLVWFSDMSCTDTLMDGNRYCSLVLTEEVAEMMSTDGAYIYAKAKRGDCLGETVEIPFEYGTHSDGGVISILDTVICKWDSYSDVVNIRKPGGYYIAPNNVAMQWTYGWEFKRNVSDKAVWSVIDGATGESLPADVVNNLVAMSVTETSPLLIRRVAMNEKGRIRYSNVVTLVHYDDLVPGELSLTTESNKFCSYDELGYVKTTPSTGGSTDGIRGIIWQYSINGKGWQEINCLDSLYLGYIAYDIENRSINNTVSIRCLYYDQCDTVESNSLDVVFYRKNEAPSIYQNNDSCDASLVKLVVYKENVKKTYHWSAIYIDPTDTTYTEKIIWNYVGDSNMIVRNSMPTSLYGIKSIDDETECVSDYYYFNVDSLPELDQTTPVAPAAICEGSDLEIKGGTLSGGNGEKTYQWQISVTGRTNDFSDIVDATDENLILPSKFMKTGSYFRRVVVDMCDTDTSEIVYVGVREKVSVSPEDLSFNDFSCPNGIFTAVVVATKDSLAASEFWSLGQDTIDIIGKYIQMEGFAGDSMEYAFIHYVTDTNGVTCQSEAVNVTAHNKPSLIKGENVISTDNFTPCNESYTKVEGTKLGGLYSDQISYSWYVNDVEQIGNFGPDLKFRAQDDMYVKRIANNGCATDTSNILHLEGQMVFYYDYEKELAMEVVSNVADSSVTMNILGSKIFGESYRFDGDGELPNVTSNNIRFPYKYDTYKDTILEVYANQSYCVKPYAIKPLRGGIISFDGNTQICGNEDISNIVATELEGGIGIVTYQWQYKNERTPDFVNIENATDKYYTPSAIDVATTYRRVATDGVYKSISNELTLSIRPLPSVAKIESGLAEETMKNMGLVYKQHEEYQWIPNAEVMEMYLVDSAYNADHTYWQKSYDKMDWQTESTDNDSMLVVDTTSLVYYRYIAESACGADTSSFVKLFTANIDPITDGQIDWANTDTFVCRNDNKLNCLRFGLVSGNSNNTQVAINNKYLYSYKVESNSNVSVWCGNSIITENSLVAYSNRVSISELDSTGNRMLPNDNVILYVTRHDTARGLSVTRSVTLNVDAFDATFAMSIENEPEIIVGENTVNRITQGDRVRFIPIVTSNMEGSMSYQWSLEEPLNKDFFNKYGGRNGIDGLTSEMKEPTCYYYNGGRYPVSLIISDGFCQKTIRDTSLYISESSLRSFNVSMSLENDLLEYIDNEFQSELNVYGRFVVFPTFVSDIVTVRSSDVLPHDAMLVDEFGRILHTVSFNGSVQISMNDYISGSYFIVVDNQERIKIMKK